MNFNSQICTTREQSKRLLALGLKRETADMMYQNYRGHCIGFGYDKYPKCITDLNILRDVDIPAWSLHRLIEMMPTVITRDDYPLTLGVNTTCVYYADGEYAEAFNTFEGNLYGCIVKCIEWLIKEGYFNKEYLKE